MCESSNNGFKSNKNIVRQCIDTDSKNIPCDCIEYLNTCTHIVYAGYSVQVQFKMQSGIHCRTDDPSHHQGPTYLPCFWVFCKSFHVTSNISNHHNFSSTRWPNVWKVDGNEFSLYYNTVRALWYTVHRHAWRENHISQEIVVAVREASW